MRTASTSKLIFGVLLLWIVSTAESKTVEYKPGQVWKTPFGGATVVTILKIENLPKLGKIVHVRIDKLPNIGCGGLEFTQSIQHLAFAEKMLRGGLTDLIEENAELPDSYFDEYRQWEKQQKHELVKIPIQQFILNASSPGPRICNFLPHQT
jgi:hypothetical protein